MPFRDMSEYEKKEALKTIESLGNALKDAVDSGMYLIARLNPALAGLLGVAYLTKNMIAFYGPDPKFDAVKSKMDEFIGKMDKMTEKMASQFTTLKAFYTENHFWNGVPLQTSVLFQFMLQVKADPKNENAVKEFAHQYEKSDPVELARRLLYQLQRDVMNPLKTAMESDPLMTKETLKKWRELIECVLSQLLHIELEASVWIRREEAKTALKFRRVKLVMMEVDRFQEEYKKWVEEYERTHPYWPNKVRQEAERLLEENSRHTTTIKATRIAESLNKVFTTAEFYVLVFPHNSKTAKYERRDNQFLMTSHSGCTAVILRSFHAFKRSDVAYALSGVNRYHKPVNDIGGITLTIGEHKDWITDAELKHWANPNMKPTGFGTCAVLFAVEDGDVAVSWTKSNMHKSGPGAYTHGLARRKSNQNNSPHRYYFFLLAVYF